MTGEKGDLDRPFTTHIHLYLPKMTAKAPKILPRVIKTDE